MNILIGISTLFYLTVANIFVILAIIAKFVRVPAIRRWKIYRFTRYIATWKMLDNE